MKLSSLLLAGVAVGGLMAAAAPAQAGAICPTTNTTVTTCNLFYTFKANGAITTSGPGGSFDLGGDDALIGVINDTNHAITSISFAGGQATDIFGFDGDGIGFYTGITNALDTSDGEYGGGDAFFTPASINDGTSAPFGPGTVNFINGGIAPGGTGYFSLENSVSDRAPPILAPEPSTWAMMLLGFGGLAFAGYRKAKTGRAVSLT
jgi:PEP-CTERM motif